MVDTLPPPTGPGKAARNEARKAMAATCNALSIALLITAGLQPLIAGRDIGAADLSILATFIALQGAAHYVLRKVED
jgi:hypothetical protein